MIKALNERVVIREDKAQDKINGILLPDNAKQKSYRGEVISVGAYVQSDVKVGNKVAYDKYSSSTIIVNNEELVVVKDENLIGVID